MAFTRPVTAPVELGSPASVLAVIGPGGFAFKGGGGLFTTSVSALVRRSETGPLKKLKSSASAAGLLVDGITLLVNNAFNCKLFATELVVVVVDKLHKGGIVDVTTAMVFLGAIFACVTVGAVVCMFIVRGRRGLNVPVICNGLNALTVLV